MAIIWLALGAASLVAWRLVRGDKDSGIKMGAAVSSTPATCDTITTSVHRRRARGNTGNLEWSWQADTEKGVVAVTSPGGVTTQHEYGQPLEQARPNAKSGDVRVFMRDTEGRICHASRGDHRYSFQYHNTGMLAEIQSDHAPNLRYVYDTQDRLIEMYIGNTVIRYRYDYLGRRAAIETPVGKITYSYQMGVNTIIRRLPNGVQTYWEHDNEGRLTKLSHVDPEDLIIAEYAYAYRPDGLINKITERTQRHGARALTYDYDRMHRLTAARASGGSAGHAYRYDALGNLAESERTDRSDALRLTSTAGGALATDSRGTVLVDERGHIRKIPHSSTPIDYEFSAQGELIAADNESVAYEYDAHGMLVSRTVKGRKTRYLPDQRTDSWRPLWQCKSDGDETILVWDRDMPLLELRGDVVRYRLEDHLGSVRVEIDGEGTATAWHDYDPYGAPVEPSRNATVAGLAPRFAGIFWDPVAKVYLAAARAYDPTTARFLQPDPVLRVPGSSPQSHSLYAYCGGDPVNFSDTTGAERRRIGNITVYVMDRALTVPVGSVKIPFPRNTPHPVVHKQFFWQGSSGEWKSWGLLRSDETPQTYDFGRDFGNLDLYSDTVKSYTVNEAAFEQAMVKVKADYMQPDHRYDVRGTWGHRRSSRPNCQDATIDVINETYRIMRPSSVVNDTFQGVYDTAQWLRQVSPSTEPKPQIDVGSIQGTVRLFRGGWDAAPVVDAVVKVFDARMITCYGEARTAERGSYSIDGLPIGKDLVVVSYHENVPESFVAHEQFTIGKGGLTQKVNALIDVTTFPRAGEVLWDRAVSFRTMDTARTIREAAEGTTHSKNVYSTSQAERTPSAMIEPAVPSPVGGVYLGGAGKTLVGFGQLKGMALDEASGKLVLIGADEETVDLPPLDLDDVVTVFRAVYNHGAPPTVTIDPDNDNPKGPIMHVKHGPGTEDTYVGWVLFECDRVMKAYQLGRDNVSRLDVHSQVPGYVDTVDKVFFGDDSHEGRADNVLSQLFGRDSSSKQRWERFWIVPATVSRFDATQGGLSLFSVPLKVNTQKMRWKEGKLVDDEKGDSSAGAKAFTAWFTEHYDEIADEVLLEPPEGSGRDGPVAIFRELRRVALIAAIAERLRDLGEPIPLWMRDHNVAKCRVERTTPSLTMEKQRNNGSVIRTATIFGGVNLAPADKDVRVYGKSSRNMMAKAPHEATVFVGQCEQETRLLTKKMPQLTHISVAAKGRSHHLGSSDGTKLSAAILPGAKTLALAPNRQRVTDMAVPIGLGRSIALTRHYNSFFNPGGEFGEGWTLNLPELQQVRIPVRRDGKQSQYRAGYHLVSPLGTMNIFFNRVENVEPYGVEMAVAAEHPHIAGVASGLCDVLQMNTRQVLFRDGSKWHFGDNGCLLLMQEDGTATRYVRNADGRLSQIVGYLGETPVVGIDLAYDAHGRIAAATQAGHPGEQDRKLAAEVRYEYGDGMRLTEIIAPRTATSADQLDDRRWSYSYEEGRLATVNGGNEVAFGYNEQGQLLWKKTGESTLTYGLAQSNDGLTLTEGLSEPDTPVREWAYDARMRPTHADLGNQVTSDWEYGKGEEVKQTVSHGDEPVFTRSVRSDGLKETTAWSGGPTYEVERDSLGRPTSVSRNGEQAVEMEWQAAGLPVCMRTTGSEIRPLRHNDGWPNGLLVSAPMKRGKTDQWTQMKWDQMGRTRAVTDSSGFGVSTHYNTHGRVSVFSRKANDGKVLVTQCTYDDQQRLVEVNAPWGREKREYFENGAIGRSVIEREGSRSESVFDRDGRIRSHRAFDGGLTRWHYENVDGGHAVQKIDLPNGETVEYARAGSGNGEVAYISHTAVTAEYDGEGRVSRLAWEAR